MDNPIKLVGQIILGLIGLGVVLWFFDSPKPTVAPPVVNVTSPVVNVAAPTRRTNAAVLVLVVNSPRGTFMQMIENYGSMEECVSAGSAPRTKWYGDVLPKDLTAAYSCIPGPDAPFSIK